MSAGERILETRLAAPARGAWVGLAEVYALLGAASFAVARFFPVLDLHYECPFRLLAGIPCATCGMTHAFVYLAHGRAADALRWSPLGTALAGTIWVLAVADAVRLAAGWPLPTLAPRTARALVLAGLLALLANWAFLVVHGLGP